MRPTTKPGQPDRPEKDRPPAGANGNAARIEEGRIGDSFAGGGADGRTVVSEPPALLIQNGGRSPSIKGTSRVENRHASKTFSIAAKPPTSPVDAAARETAGANRDGNPLAADCMVRGENPRHAPSERMKHSAASPHPSPVKPRVLSASPATIHPSGDGLPFAAIGDGQPTTVKAPALPGDNHVAPTIRPALVGLGVTANPLRRFLIYTGRARASWLCVVAARDKRHALTVARRYFSISSSGFALEETWLERSAA